MSDTTQIELALLLPSIPHARDACVHRLAELLSTKDGITIAHLVDQGDSSALCIHYDANRISASDVRSLARRAGAEIDERYGHFLLRIAPMHARLARTVESKVRRVEGVLEAVVSPSGELRIEYDRQRSSEAEIRSKLPGAGVTSELTSKTANVGKDVRPEESTQAEHGEHGGWLGENAELWFAVACGLVLLIGWLLTFTAVPWWAPLGFYLAAYFFGGFHTTREAFEAIRSGIFEIDFLMLVAALGAASLGEWAEGALLLFLFSLGHALEHYAMGRAKRAIEALATLAPQTAFIRRGDKTEEIRVEQLKLGDVVLVKPNERIPADGIVVKGASAVNQAPITGESIPVDKEAVDEPDVAAKKGDQLDPRYRTFAGSINGAGSLEIRVTKLAGESTLARVIQMVNEAETQKSPTQRFTDQFERYFVPAALALCVLLLFAWVVIDEPFSRSFYRAMAVLVAASPCALAIATPSAVLSGVARAARGGVLVKGGGPLENLGRLNAIAFDKTGTLTEGKPRLTDVVAFRDVADDDLLLVAVAVEEHSDHPLASAVVQGGKDRLKTDKIPLAQDVESITGRGVKAMLGDRAIYIGKDKLFSEIAGPPIPEELLVALEKLKISGRTTMVVRRDNDYLGVLGMMDTPRASAIDVISKLKDLGITRTIMLSGDNQQVANAVAKQVGIEEALGDLMPDDKVKQIAKLNQDQGVAMVGDGVNDAPAMANATVGIAMGAAGSDVALETADVALMADDLNHLPFAVGLSRQTSRIIRQNLWFSLGMVLCLIPATILGLQMGAAVLFHEGSTLLVVANALRLLGYRG